MAASARITLLRRREAALDDAYVFERRVDASTYERQRDMLREEIALVQIELEDARIDVVDIEGLLEFAEHLLANASRLWMEASPNKRQQLQRVLFPEGLRFRDGGLGTAVSCFAFTQLAAIGDGKSRGVPNGIANVGPRRGAHAACRIGPQSCSHGTGIRGHAFPLLQSANIGTNAYDVLRRRPRAPTPASSRPSNAEWRTALLDRGWV
jgi:hypothetical protein